MSARGHPRHVRWLFLPVLGSPLAHAPVLRFDLMSRLNRPIDGGRTLRGRRLLGDNKTWRGAAVMFSGTLTATHLLWRRPEYRARLPAEVRGAGPSVIGVVLGAGVVLGEFPNSFAKRQMGVPPGAQAPLPARPLLSLVDQADFVLTTWFFLRPVFRMSARQVLDASLTVTAAHLPINLIGYLIGARKTPI